MMAANALFPRVEGIGKATGKQAIRLLQLILLLPEPAWSQPPVLQQQNEAFAISLSVDSFGISGRYHGSLEEVLLGLRPDYDIHCDCPEKISNLIVHGTVQNLPLHRFLQKLLSPQSYLLVSDTPNRRVHIQLLSKPTAATVVDNTPYPEIQPILYEDPIDFQTRQAFAKMPLSLRKQFEIANQATDIPPEWHDQFAVAYQDPLNQGDLPPEFQVDIDKEALPPEQLAAFTIATENPQVPVNLEELFYVNVSISEIPYDPAVYPVIPGMMTERPDFTLQMER